MKSFVFVLLFIIVSFSGTQAQTVSITVLDKKDKSPLYGVNILQGDTGYYTDIDGKFLLDISKMPVILTLSYVGYKTVSIEFADQSSVTLQIFMEELDLMLDQVTVTGSKYEQNITKSTVSIDILKSELLRSVNATGSDEILNKIPGVQVLDGQANIRGGSGYSYGAGSRVMLLMDDVPALQPDAGFPNWNDIPIENLSQIEVLKGAASTLYGSAALNGIINFRSSYATSKPETRFSAAGTVFMTPKDEAKKWWKDTLRYESNFTFVHKQKIGKLDVIASGLYNKLEGFNQFTNENRGRGNLNVRYRITDRLTAQLGLLANFNNSNSFFLWANPASGAMRPYDGTVSDRKSSRIYIDPSLTYHDKFDNKHRVMTRTIFVDNRNNTNQSNKSINQYSEYQFQRNFTKQKIILTTGIVGAWTSVDSEILGDTIFKANNYASYLQVDKSFKKLTLAGGIRYEYVSQMSPENFKGDIIPGGKASDDRWIGRIAANYSVSEYSSLRLSLGQGYRYPTLTERFVTTSFSRFSVFANPYLKPETGWSSELGYKQGFSLGGFKGYLDIARFVSEYKDMIEFTFVGEQNRFGFQPQNIGNTRISGYEISVAGQANLFGIPITILGGYTYIDPVYKNFDTSADIRNSVSETKNVLKYRSKHQAKIDAEAKYNNFKWGVSLQRVSHVINIDKAFEAVPPVSIDLFGIGQYRDFNNNGYTLLDSRISFQTGSLTITALVNNILNVEYTLRPALIEAPRNIGLRLDYKLN
jgi:outer membrane receptor protein involved in Fe transport